ncbi:multicopper oxidase domain-containing protein [Streptomyces sp. NPDC001393]
MTGTPDRSSTANHALPRPPDRGGYQTLDLHFTADQPGLSLFHCHQQLHMDYGFMILLRCS